jgi:ubiquinone/menaquinone biosynthesis C-methylase UbiE
VASADLPLPARAFDTIAASFDARFGQWESVAAQRRAVRRELAKAFPPGANVLEIGGGTGEDALWLAERGRSVVMTDISPRMVQRARTKFAGRQRLRAQVAAAEGLDRLDLGEAGFDGAFSNFAALNCVEALEPVARGLARLVKPSGAVIMVVFGTCCPGEWIVEGLRDNPRAMFRRFRRTPVRARLGGNAFLVRYFRTAELVSAMAPWFDFAGRRGLGVFVPPSAAEPWITRHPRLLSALERLDDRLSSSLAGLGDHVLHRFVRRADD